MADSPQWRPSAALEMLQIRARILEAVRAFFSARGVMEVETPILSMGAATDLHLESFQTAYTGPGFAQDGALYLHTSPEFPMKRLLAAGSGPIYQICHVFRQGEAGRRHNPEFTLLEWYRPGFDHQALMDEVEALATSLLAQRLEGAAERLTYREAFLRHAALDPFVATLEALRQAARRFGIQGDVGAERDTWLDLLLTHAVEPNLGRGRLCFLHDYPPSQAALARLGRDATGGLVAERFELYFDGVELANGFHELSDAAEQRDRFASDNVERSRRGLPVMPYDERLLAALAAGLPDCAGVALGIDRLVMLAAGVGSLEEVMAFPLERS